MVRFYLCDVIGDGASLATGFRPALAALVPASVRWTAADDRADATAPAGKMLVRADTTLAEHAALIADARITFIALRAALIQRIRDRIHPDWEL